MADIQFAETYLREGKAELAVDYLDGVTDQIRSNILTAAEQGRVSVQDVNIGVFFDIEEHKAILYLRAPGQ